MICNSELDLLKCSAYVCGFALQVPQVVQVRVSEAILSHDFMRDGRLFVYEFTESAFGCRTYYAEHTASVFLQRN